MAMSPQVSSLLQPLADAIDGLDLPVDNDLLAEAFGLADRLNAKLVAAVGEHDVAEVWRNDGEWQHATPCPEWTVLGLCCHQAIRKVQSTEHAVESM